MHGHRGGDGLFDLDHFLVGLDGALVDDRADEVDRRVFGKRGQGEPQEPRKQNRIVGPVRRQEAHRPTRSHRRLHGVGERRAWASVGHARLGSAFGDRGQVAHPHDVIDSQLVAEDGGAALVDIDHRRQLRLIETEVVEKSTVLAEGVAVVRVVHRALVVAQKQEQPVVKPVLQNCASLFIGWAWKHQGAPLMRIQIQAIVIPQKRGCRAFSKTLMVGQRPPYFEPTIRASCRVGVAPPSVTHLAGGRRGDEPRELGHLPRGPRRRSEPRSSLPPRRTPRATTPRRSRNRNG